MFPTMFRPREIPNIQGNRTFHFSRLVIASYPRYRSFARLCYNFRGKQHMTKEEHSASQLVCQSVNFFFPSSDCIGHS